MGIVGAIRLCAGALGCRECPVSLMPIYCIARCPLCPSVAASPMTAVLQDKSLYHPVSGSCVDCSESERRVFMSTCDPASRTQQWVFQFVNASVLEQFSRS